jgi:hypothetical protein
MAGYTRQDTANNIANGNVVDADDLDNEFNAVEDAFNASAGHTHDGTAGEGAPITKMGPGQDIIVGTTTVLPKANNVLDLGSAAAQFKDAFFDGIVYTDTANIGGNGYTTLSDNEYTVSTGGLTFDVAGDITLDADGGNVLLQDGGVDYGKLANNANQLSIYSGTTEALRLNGSDVDALGTLDVTSNATVGGTLTVTGNTSVSTGNFTVNTGNVSIGGTLGVTGTITGNLSGTVTGNVTGDVTGQVSDISNHSTTDLSEGTNLYYTDTRARNSVSATGSLSYNSSTGEFSYTQGSTDTVAEGSSNLYYTDARVQTYISGNRTYGNVTSTGNVIVQGNLTVSGTTTTVNTETINLADNVITLNSNEAGTPSQNGGIEIERGTAANKTFIWDEANDYWTVGSETLVAATFDGNLTGNVTGNVTGTVSSISNHDTGDLSEGSNLYYTDARADARIAAASITDLSDADQTVRTTDSPTFVTVNATTVDLGDWTITESAGVLYFATAGTNKMTLDASGNLVVTGNVTAYGTV